MADEKQPDDELGVLFPDVELTITGPGSGKPVQLTVKAFRFLPGLKAQVLARPLVDALADFVEKDEDVELDTIAQVLADHAEAWIALISLATDRDPEWIAGLPENDGDALSEAMWEANGDFLSRRVAAAVAARKQEKAAGKPGKKSPSRKSSTRS